VVEPEGPPRGLSARRALAAGLAFGLGVAATGAVLALALYPAATYRAYARARYGAVPSSDGLLLTLRPAPDGVAGPTGGPWVVAELRELRGAPRDLLLAEGAFVLEVTGPDGDPLPPRAFDPISEARPPEPTPLPAGGRVGLPLDVGARAALPGPGRYAVRATWTVARRDRLEVVRSNALEVTVD